MLLRRPFILFALFALASRATSTSRRWRHVPRHRRDAPRSWAHDRLADVAVDDINYTTRSNVDVGSIAKAAAAKIGP